MHGRSGQGGSIDDRRAGAQDKAGQGLGHSSLVRAYPRQAEAAEQIDVALQDALNNPKQRMLGATPVSVVLAFLVLILRTFGLTRLSGT